MTMKQALTSAGLNETPEVKKPEPVKYKVLHIPSASYLLAFETKTDSFKLAVFANKAKAGHARDDYRLQRYKSRSYAGSGLFLQEDIKEAPKDRYGRNVNLWQLQSIIREKFKSHGNLHKEEFELVPVEVTDVDTLSVDN